MHCTTVEYVYAATVAVFVLVAVFGSWWHSSLIKILELRHASTYALLGKPHPLRTAASSRHAIGIVQFVLQGEHKMLNDENVNEHVRVLRCCLALGATTLVALVASVFLAASPDSLLSFGCWRNQ